MSRVVDRLDGMVLDQGHDVDNPRDGDISEFDGPGGLLVATAQTDGDNAASAGNARCGSQHSRRPPHKRSGLAGTCHRTDLLVVGFGAKQLL